LRLPREGAIADLKGRVFKVVGICTVFGRQDLSLRSGAPWQFPSGEKQPFVRVEQAGSMSGRKIKERNMSKAFIASVIQESTSCTGVAANVAAGALIDAIVKELKKEGGFTLPSFGTFSVKKTKARKAMNPRTGEPVKVKAGKTVRFKASPNLKKAV
jgi:DNA-binding protein HU-beta